MSWRGSYCFRRPTQTQKYYVDPDPTGVCVFHMRVWRGQPEKKLTVTSCIETKKQKTKNKKQVGLVIYLEYLAFLPEKH